MSRKIPEDVREEVRRRARFLCEYCHTNERWQYVRFTIDHITPDENDSLENLALACFHCNRRKSDKLLLTVNKAKKNSRFSIRAQTFGKIISFGLTAKS